MQKSPGQRAHNFYDFKYLRCKRHCWHRNSLLVSLHLGTTGDGRSTKLYVVRTLGVGSFCLEHQVQNVKDHHSKGGWTNRWPNGQMHVLIMNQVALSRVEEIDISLGALDPTVAGELSAYEHSRVPPFPVKPSPSAAEEKQEEAEASALQAVLDAEVSRASSWSIVLLYLCAVAVLLLPMLTGNPVLKRVCIGALATLGVVSAWVWHSIHHRAAYSPKVFRIFGWTAAAASLPIELYLGVFSPTPIVITLGISFFAFSMDRVHACAVSLVAIFGYASLAALITFGFMEDPGIYAPENLSMGARLFMLVMVPSVLLATLWLARRSRETMHRAIVQATDQVQRDQTRGNELANAEESLSNALKVPAGESGRYTHGRAGSYQIQNVVARGAVGEIYRAKHRTTGLPAAVKVLQAAAIYRSAAVTRFIREGNLVRRIASPHVVAIHEVGEMEDGLPYLAMEWLNGKDLSAHLRDGSHFDLDQAAVLVREVGQGLQAAHAMNIVHRDLKPSNLFFTQGNKSESSKWKILDFGVSKLTDSEGTLTRDGLIGTPGYMSPEQARGYESDHRSDIFSFGAVLYRALTGHTPFTATNLPQTLFRIVYVNALHPNHWAPNLPVDIIRFLALVLAKRPGDRPSNIETLMATFEKARVGNLSPHLRQRADSLIERSPWGADLSNQAGAPFPNTEPLEPINED